MLPAGPPGTSAAALVPCHGHKRHCQNTKSALHDKHPRRSLDVRLQPSRGKTKLNRTMTDGRISIPALPRRWSGKGVCAAVFANNGRIIHWHGSIHAREPDSKFEIKRQPPGPPHVRRSNQRAFRYGPSSCIPMFYSISSKKEFRRHESGDARPSMVTVDASRTELRASGRCSLP